MSRKVKLVLIVTLAVITCALIIALVLNGDHDMQRKNEAIAILVGVEHAKKECISEGISKPICDSITGSASTTDCQGKPCWIVYAQSQNRTKFSSGVTIQRDSSSQLKVIKYQRSQITN